MTSALLVFSQMIDGDSRPQGSFQVRKLDQDFLFSVVCFTQKAAVTVLSAHNNNNNNNNNKISLFRMAL